MITSYVTFSFHSRAKRGRVVKTTRVITRKQIADRSRRHDRHGTLETGSVTCTSAPHSLSGSRRPETRSRGSYHTSASTFSDAEKRFRGSFNAWNSTMLDLEVIWNRDHSLMIPITEGFGLCAIGENSLRTKCKRAR